MDLASAVALLIQVSIMLVVLGLGLNSSWREALYLFRHPGLLFRTLLAMNVIMPLVAVGFALAFELPAAMKLALVALAISPVPPLVSKKELNAGGYASYAMGLSFASAVLAIVTVPLAVAWLSSAFERASEVSPLAIAKIVLSSVLLPLAIGIVVHHWLPAVATRIARPVARLGIVLLVVGLVPLAYAFWPAIRALLHNGTVLIIAAMAAIGLGIGHVLGGPNPAHRTVLALSTASRHPAVALAVAVARGIDSKPALAAILLYVIVAALISVPYVMWRKRQAVTIHASVDPDGRAPNKATNP